MPGVRSQYGRNVLMLVTGTSVAQAITLAVSPILTRLYTPHDFGVMAVYVSVASIAGTMAALRYELAIMLPVEDREAAALFRLCVMASLAMGAVSAVMVAVLGHTIALALGNMDVQPWLYLLPAAIVLTGIYQALRFWWNRKVAYKRIAHSAVMQSGGAATAQVGFGMFSAGSGGLIVGTVLGLVAATLALGLSFVRHAGVRARKADWKEMRHAARKYRNHPFHLLPAQTIGVIAQSLPVIILSKAFEATVVGFFSLAYRLVTLPTTLIGTAVGDVYRQRITVAYNARGEFRREFVRTLWTTAMIAFPCTVALYIAAPALFSLVFGPEWRVAGEYAQILCVAAFFQLTFTPVDKNALVVGATRYIVVWHVVRFLLFLGLLAWVMNEVISVEAVLWVFVAINAALYAVDGVVAYRFSLGVRTRTAAGSVSL